MKLKAATKIDKEGAVLFLFTVEKWATKKDDLLDLSGARSLAELLKHKKIFQADKNEIFGGFSGEANRYVVFCGLGKEEECSFTSIATALKNALEKIPSKIAKITIVPYQDKKEFVAPICFGSLIGSYKWEKYLSKKDEVERSCFLITKHQETVARVLIYVEGMTLTRDLTNENADEATAACFEKTIRSLAKGQKNVKIEVLGEKELKRAGLNLLLAVNQGSNKPPRLIIVTYTGNKKSKDYCALLGKGVTFDSGGLNLKVGGGIETMRDDMAGAAGIVGTLSNVLEIKPAVNVIFACALVENAISRDAYKPGDVIKGYNGKTVEIASTDAEGRLILADAMAYLVDKYRVTTLVDVATLTGAVVIALGRDHSGMICNDDGLAAELLAAARNVDDRLWRLPLYPELREHIKSKYADLKNIGISKTAGTLAGAEFLRQFIKEGIRWAHLDIAGTAFLENPQWYYNYGATGASVRLLTEFLCRKFS